MRAVPTPGDTMRPIAITVFLLTLAAAAPAPARDVDGVNVPDSLTVPGEKKTLILNGAGLRKRLFVKVYVGALYTVDPIAQAERVLGATTTRVMRLQFVRAIEAETLAKGWKDSFAANHSPFEMQGLDTRLAQFNGYMPNVKENDVLRIDLLPRGTTQVAVNDQVRGTIEGVDFQRAVLKAWIGPKPADGDLKKAVLGGKK